MQQVQILVGDLHRGRLGSPEVTNKFLLIAHGWKVLRHGCGLIELVSSRRIGWYATWPSWVNMWSHTWSWPESYMYWPDYSKPPCVCFDAPWQEEHDGARIMPLAVLVQKLFAKKRFRQKQLFLRFLPVMPKSLTLAQIWPHVSGRTA